VSTPFSRRAVGAAVLVTICLAAAAPALTARGTHASATTASRATQSHVTTSTMERTVVRAYSAAPLRFEAVGQAGSQTAFTAHGRGYALSLGPMEATLELTTHAHPRPALARTSSTSARSTTTTVLRLRLRGGNPHPRIVGLHQLPGESNYLIGANARAWRTGVRAYARVVYHDVYPGVDLIYYGSNGKLEYDLVCAPGVDPRVVSLVVDGAGHLSIDRRGALSVATRGGTLLQQAPVIYQTTATGRRAVTGGYRFLDARHTVVGLQVGSYDHRLGLTVDPVLDYSTYMGGSNVDYGLGIAVDRQGAAYVTGVTESTNFTPTAGAYQTTQNGVDSAFITKYSPTGAVVYQTYLGGSSEDNGEAIAVNAAGAAYVTGLTQSTDFPTTTGAYSTTKAGTGLNAFITELNPAGSGLVFSTYLGGSNNTDGKGIALTNTGAVVVVGQTAANDFPTKNPLQPAYNGGGDAFVTELNPAGAALVYSTYLGGTDSDIANAVAVDSAGNAYVVGSTSSSTNFPTSSGAFQATFGGAGTGADGSDAFVTKIGPSGSTLVYSTYLGGNDNDEANAVAVTGAGAAYVTGLTSSTTFPTTSGVLQPTKSGPSNTNNMTTTNAFVTSLNADGTALTYSTYLAGTNDDEGSAIAVDAAGEAYVAGSTFSTDFPTVNAIQTTNNAASGGESNAFVAKLNPTASGLLYSTYLGGSGSNGAGGPDQGDGASAIALGPATGAPSIYLTGYAISANFPTMQPAQGANGGVEDGVTVRIDEPAATPTNTATPVPGAPTSTLVPGAPTSTLVPGAPTATLVPGAPTATRTPTLVPGAPTATLVPGAPTPTRTATLVPGAPTATLVPGAPTATLVPGAPTSTLVPGAPTSTLVPGAPTSTLVPGAPTSTLVPGAPTATLSPIVSTVNDARPSIAVQPSVVRPGDAATVTGRGFSPNETITLALNGSAFNTRPTEVTTRGDGTFTAVFTAPSTLLNGANTISAIGARGGRTAVTTLTGILPVAARFYFAGAVQSAAEPATLQVLNPTNGAARVHLTLYFADGATMNGEATVHATSQSSLPIVLFTKHSGTFGLTLTANRGIAAQVLLARRGQDGDTLRPDTGLQNTWYLAEGYTGLTFHERIGILNTDATHASHVKIHLLATGGRGNRTVVLTVPPHTDATLDANHLLKGRSLSALITTDRPVAVERTLGFAQGGSGLGYGATSRMGINVASRNWLFAEGATVNHFETFLTYLNPSTRTAHVTTRFYGRTGLELARRTMTVAANSRATLKVNGVLHAAGVSSAMSSDVPIVVERPEYFGSPNATRVAGSDVFGLNGPGLRWSFADGATTSAESEFLLLYNPAPVAVPVRVTLYGRNGKQFAVALSLPARSRYTLDMHHTAPRFTQLHGSQVVSLNGQGIVVEQTVFAANRTTLRSTEGFAQ